jgi:hypothetical protein
MMARIFQIFSVAALVFAGCVFCCAQNADNKTSVFSKSDDDDHPKSFQESLLKMRIEKEKKDYDEMIQRGQLALKISEQIETIYSQKGHLTETEFAELSKVEKLVKKIRDDLGGDDDDENKEQSAAQVRSMPIADALKTLRTTAVNLYDELKTTTRFSISAGAIQSSNAILRLARFLRITK